MHGTKIICLNLNFIPSVSVSVSTCSQWTCHVTITSPQSCIKEVQCSNHQQTSPSLIFERAPEVICSSKDIKKMWRVASLHKRKKLWCLPEHHVLSPRFICWKRWRGRCVTFVRTCSIPSSLQKSSWASALKYLETYKRVIYDLVSLEIC